MNFKKYYPATKVTVGLGMLLGSAIIVLGIIFLAMAYTSGNKIFYYFNDMLARNDGSRMWGSGWFKDSVIFGIVSLCMGAVILILSVAAHSGKKVFALNVAVFMIFGIYYLVVFIFLATYGNFDYFTVDCFAYIAFFILLWWMAIEMICDLKGKDLSIYKNSRLAAENQTVQIKLIDESTAAKEQENLQLSTTAKPVLADDETDEKNVIEEPKLVVEDETSKELDENHLADDDHSKQNDDKPIKVKEEPKITFETPFEEPTLEDKSEEEKVLIQKRWEDFAEKLNALKFKTLKEIAEQRKISVPFGIPKTKVVALLKKIVNIEISYTSPANASSLLELNAECLGSCTLVELRKLARTKDIPIPGGFKKADVVELLKDKVWVTIEFIV